MRIVRGDDGGVPTLRALFSHAYLPKRSQPAVRAGEAHAPVAGQSRRRLWALRYIPAIREATNWISSSVSLDCTV